jgi:hypothetical protein
VRESFKTTKRYIWKGVYAFLFYFAALYTLKDGVLPIMAQTFPGTDSTPKQDAASIVIPLTEVTNDLIGDVTTGDENLDQ